MNKRRKLGWAIKVRRSWVLQFSNGDYRTFKRTFEIKRNIVGIWKSDVEKYFEVILMHKVKVEHSFPFLKNIFIVGCCLLILIIGISVVDYYNTKTSKKYQEQVSYTQFLKQVEEQKVSRVTIEHNKMIGVLKNGQVISTDIPVSADLIETLKKNNVEYRF